MVPKSTITAIHPIISTAELDAIEAFYKAATQLGLCTVETRPTDESNVVQYIVTPLTRTGAIQYDKLAGWRILIDDTGTEVSFEPGQRPIKPDTRVTFIVPHGAPEPQPTDILPLNCWWFSEY